MTVQSDAPALSCPFLKRCGNESKCEALVSPAPVALDWQIRYCLTPRYPECRRFQNAQPDKASDSSRRPALIAVAASVGLLAIVALLLVLVDFSSLPGLDDGDGSVNPTTPPVAGVSLPGALTGTPEPRSESGAASSPASAVSGAATPEPSPASNAPPTPTPQPTPESTAVVTPTPSSTATPTPEPTAVPSATPEVPLTAPAIHTVVAGDTVENLAQRYATTTTMLQAANQPAALSNLVEGTQLFIPSADGLMPEGAPFRAVHIVQSGETLANIGGLYGVSADSIATSNQIVDVNLIREGMVLYIPNGEVTTPSPAPVDPLQPVTPVPSGVTHVVVDGETLYSISTQYGVTVQAIMDANGLTDPTYVVSGWVLTIPGF